VVTNTSLSVLCVFCVSNSDFGPINSGLLPASIEICRGPWMTMILTGCAARFLECDPLLYQQLMLLAVACRNFHVQTLCEEGSPCSADHAICVLHGPMAGVTSLLGCCSNVPSDLSIHEVRFRGTLRHSHGQQQSEPSAALHWSQTSTFCPPKHPGGWRCIADYSN